MPGRLEGKVAVITGAASGIGRETAKRFAEEGARVCVADLADEPGKETAAEIDGLYIHADVTDPDDVQAMYREAAQSFGGLPMGRFAEATEIANGALFLASDEASYVTASTFLVDGGLSGAYVTPE